MNKLFLLLDFFLHVNDGDGKGEACTDVGNEHLGVIILDLSKLTDESSPSPHPPVPIPRVIPNPAVKPSPKPRHSVDLLDLTC